MVKYRGIIVCMSVLTLSTASPDTGFARSDDAKSATAFIQQMTDKTKACEQTGISEQECVCRSKAEWQDMLALMQLMRTYPDVDAANRAVLDEGVKKVQELLDHCR